jgi:hypothetical protein
MTSESYPSMESIINVANLRDRSGPAQFPDDINPTGSKTPIRGRDARISVFIGTRTDEGASGNHRYRKAE